MCLLIDFTGVGFLVQLWKLQEVVRQLEFGACLTKEISSNLNRRNRPGAHT